MRGRPTMVPIAVGAELADAASSPLVRTAGTSNRGCAGRDLGHSRQSADWFAVDLFKKIDSTLRGHIGVEITAALTAFGYDAAVVCPFSTDESHGRSGMLACRRRRILRRSKSRSLSRTGVERCVHIKHEASRKQSLPARIVVLDAVCDDDLTGSPPRVWRSISASCGGIGGPRVRAGTHAADPAHLDLDQRPKAPCCSVSDRITGDRRQQTALVANAGAAVHAELTNRSPLQRAGSRPARRAAHSMRSGSAERLKELVACAHASALVLSGGDTASRFAEPPECGVSIFLMKLFRSSCGVIRGGVFDGISVAQIRRIWAS